MTLIKVGLIAFGLILTMVFILTLISHARSGDDTTSANPYKRNYPGENQDSSPTVSPKEQEFKIDAEEPPQETARDFPEPDSTSAKGRDIGAKPKDFNLYKHDKK